MDTLTTILLVLGIWIILSAPIIRIVFELITKNQQCGVIGFEPTKYKTIRNKVTLPFYGLLPFTYGGKWYWGKFVVIKEIEVTPGKWVKIGSEVKTINKK